MAFKVTVKTQGVKHTTPSDWGLCASRSDVVKNKDCVEIRGQMHARESRFRLRCEGFYMPHLSIWTLFCA